MPTSRRLRTRPVAGLASTLMLLLAGLLVAAQAWAATDASNPPWAPTRPIRILHGFQAGGPPDIALRRVASHLEARLGQPVVVENRPGATGTIAAAAVARAVPDGHTLLFGVAANLAVAPAMMAPPPYDPAKAFTAIIEVARGPYVWIVRSDAPAKDLAEFAAWARTAPGKLNYASPGIGSVHHLATEMFKQAASIDMVHVPYKGGLYAGLLAGDVQAMFESMPGPLPHLKAGKIRILAVTGPRRLAILPDVPTFAEQGAGDIDANSWWGFAGPAGLPEPVVARLNTEIATALSQPELLATMAQWGIEPSPGTPGEFSTYVAAEAAKWRDRVERFGIKPE
jgi:tripartite-type tricarboxylate transporter receptor subunit TctC